MSKLLTIAFSCATLIGAGCVQMGSQSAKTTATGSAGGATATNVNPSLERCDSPVGTTSFIEDTAAPWYQTVHNQYGLPSTTMVLRMLAQQSNCFIVVERGKALSAVEGERRLERSGETRPGSNFGPGQLVAADYAITPSVIFSSGDTGGLNGVLAGLSQHFPQLGGVSGGVKKKEAATMLALTDNRSGVQVAIAEGSASAVNFNVEGWGIGLPGAAIAGLGGYAKTPEGKIIAASFTDSFNQLVRAVKTYRPQESSGPNGSGTGGKLKVN
jgi:curli biogenesis system outer membrane secretion channel CsgG